ncbi:MAG: WecB/TagA/CpsF family glycosyltransferase [Candidatus Doudnabacteria bacterium]|nr:WecB/TagA/CpsF family glycosyltransferase [Candidatus Doudnabacteria bacterium]
MPKIRYNYHMAKIDIAGLKIDSLTKQELLAVLLSRTIASQKTWITTVYSEFLHAALRDLKITGMLNQADIAIADGIGIFWAQKFLSIPLTAKSYWLKILQAYWQVIYGLFTLPGRWKEIQSGADDLKDRIPGSELIWDIARLAVENNLSIYLLGGFDDTSKLVSNKLTSSFYSGRYKMMIGYSNKNADDLSVIDDINNFHPDILFVAYGPIKQEKWIYENLPKLPSIKIIMGVGGSFDYIAGKRLAPPSLVRKIGLEWLWRLFTQPHRIKRVWNATLGLIMMLVRYKIFMSYGYRKNAACIIVNRQNQILVVQRSKFDQRWENKQPEEYKNYWQFPQGGIDAKENLIDGAKREIYEETGIVSLELIAVSKHKNSYLFRHGLRPLFRNRLYLYKGQEQSIVYFRFIGKETEINLDKRELINHRWINIIELEKTVNPERLVLAKIVQKDLLQMRQKGII